MTRIKHGGRTAGTPNRLTSELKDLIKNVIEQQLETLNDTLEKLEPRERLEIICKLLPYVIAKEAEKPVLLEDEDNDSTVYVTTNISVYRREDDENDFSRNNL